MISICIPVYNFDVTNLVTELHSQGVTAAIPFEILVMDDASACCKEKNRLLQSLPFVQYFELEANLGRSRIRNQMALKARYNYLLYIDCDAEVVSPNYIKNYLNYCYKDVVCYGGIAYAPTCPSPEVYLRWRIGVKREAINAYRRSRKPNRNFSTFNFLMDRDFFLNVSFNEQLVGYGHEDTLFSFDLFKHNVIVRHIENPLRHIGLENGPVTLIKCREGIKNARTIVRLLNNDPLFIKSMPLLVWGRRMDKLHLRPLLAFFFRNFHKFMEVNLLHKYAWMPLFGFWKLSYYCYLENEPAPGEAEKKLL